jgi:hypothetical protein
MLSCAGMCRRLVVSGLAQVCTHARYQGKAIQSDKMYAILLSGKFSGRLSCLNTTRSTMECNGMTSPQQGTKVSLSLNTLRAIARPHVYRLPCNPNRDLLSNNTNQSRRTSITPGHDRHSIRRPVEAGVVSFLDISLTRFGTDPDAEDRKATACGGRLFELCVEGTGQAVAHSDVVAKAACDDNLCSFVQLFQIAWGGRFQLVCRHVEVPGHGVSDH